MPVPGSGHSSSAQPAALASTYFVPGVSQIKVLCAQLLTSSFLLSGKQLGALQRREASNLFAHDGWSENSILTLPWWLNPYVSVSTFVTASRHLELCQQLLRKASASRKTLGKVQQDQCREGGSRDTSSLL